jgi:hypothetical protein
VCVLWNQLTSWPHCKQDLIYVFPEMKLYGLVPNFSRLGHLFCCNKIGGPIVGMYKSLTDTWILEWGTRPRCFISGNICFGFSEQCLCSAAWHCLHRAPSHMSLKWLCVGVLQTNLFISVKINATYGISKKFERHL